MNIGETFDWSRPRFEAPDLPDPEHVASRPCSLGGGDVLTEESAAAHVSDLAALEDLADRFGVPCGDGKVSDLSRSPTRSAARRSAGRSTRCSATYHESPPGGVAEWSNAPVLKTGDGATRPRVRIPPPPL